MIHLGKYKSAGLAGVYQKSWICQMEHNICMYLSRAHLELNVYVNNAHVKETLNKMHKVRERLHNCHPNLL